LRSKDGKPTVLITSYIDPTLVNVIKERAPQFDVIYRPDLLYKPKHATDHTSIPQRNAEQEAEWKDLLSTAEVLFDFDHSHMDDLPELAPNLKWIQATSAGIGQFVRSKKYAERTNWIFTTASGVHIRPLAEFVAMSMLLFAKDYFRIEEQQSKKVWTYFTAHELREYTLGIIGLGKIGREIARVAKAFDMKVVGTRRDPQGSLPNVDELYSPAELSKVLTQSNFLCISAPHTDETTNMIGAKEIAQLPDKAIFINISRGAVVDEAALLDALKSGKLGGAALDVFAREPLPPDSQFWTLPRVIVSPHSASNGVNENVRIVDIFCENLKRYSEGKSLLNVLDTKKLY
jgi:glyoxylate/hydroxypyruvate reductase